MSSASDALPAAAAPSAVEANYDGLVGPTHNYAGLSLGNRASEKNFGSASRPREAVLQGLAKAKRLADWGLVQGVLPPQERPDVRVLRAAGFSGSDMDVLAAAWRDAPDLAAAACSASSMWAANAATVSPSADTADGRLHLTPANLRTMLHRSFEHEQTRHALLAAFPKPERVAVHAALPSHPVFGDEGAANHMRLCADHGQPGVEIFVFGAGAGEASAMSVPVRQAPLTGEAIARHHGLDPARVVHLQQSTTALEAGAFHNDVVAVGARNVLFFHEDAFADPDAALEAIKRAADGVFEPVFVCVRRDELPLADAIESYLFNSQLLAVPGEAGLLLLAPEEARENPRANAVCERLNAEGGPIARVEFIDVRQSMRNGGGPACLRLRVVLTEAERASAHRSLFLTDDTYADLTEWAGRWYREELSPDDLRDPDLLMESRGALDELTGILGLRADFYPFQRTP